MKNKNAFNNRRNFIKKTTLGTSGLFTLPLLAQANHLPIKYEDDLNLIGPKKGFTPQVGTLVSMMNFMRDIVIRSARGLTIKNLDYLHDENSNSIGAMLWHLASVERYYQRNTFDGKQWTGLAKNDAAKWSAASDLGNAGRTKIKGYDIDFYLNLLKEVRAFSIAEMKKRDDNWLMKKDNSWGGPTNNYCKWFHVVEHESNHNGQIKYIKSRLHSN